MKVIVTAYNPKWPQAFQEEAELITQVLQKEIVKIHHIGSTSVPGLHAKPIIDMIPVVKDITRIDDYTNEMAAIGYEGLGEYGILGRRYFRKGGDHRTHQLHLFDENQVEAIERHVAVRDYLRMHPEEAVQYGSLKKQLAAQFPNDIDAYIDGKDLFVKQLEQRALIWKKIVKG